MLDALRYRLGYRVAQRAARSRGPVGEGAATGPRVLALLPTEEEPARDAWAFVRSLGLSPRELIAVVAADRIPYAPDAYVGHVRTVGEKDLDWRGLPRRTVTEALWDAPLALALDLNPSFDLASAHLVGGSAARLRVGLHSDEGEPFYDLLVAPTEGYREALAALRRYLAAVAPPVLDLAG